MRLLLSCCIREELFSVCCKQADTHKHNGNIDSRLNLRNFAGCSERTTARVFNPLDLLVAHSPLSFFLILLLPIARQQTGQPVVVVVAVAVAV